MKKDYTSVSNGRSGKKHPLSILATVLFVLAVSAWTLIGPQTAMAQAKEVSGQVLDAAGEPIIGASVRVKGTGPVVVSDVDGKFRLSNVAANSVLEFRYIGYVTQDVEVGNRSVVDVTMQEEALQMDATIVIGYGKTSQRNLASAVSTIKPGSLDGVPVTSVVQSLAGRAPGLIVTQNGGGINANGAISIRGGGTPLVVINGIISSYRDFELINPEDLATFSILKDAAATAVYGSRAGDGIILVTTKSGSGRTTVKISTDVMFSQPVLLEGKLSSFDRLSMVNTAQTMYGLPATYTEEQLQKYKVGTDPQFANYDWQKAGLRDWAPIQRYNISLNGGTETNNYYLSLGMMDQQTNFKENTNNQQRYNFRLAQSSLIKSIGLKISPSVEGYIENTIAPMSPTASSGIDGYYNAVFGHIQNKTPMQIGTTPEGLLYSGTTDNPLAEMSPQAGYHKRNQTRLRGQLEVAWALPWVEGLEIKAVGNYSTTIQNDKKWNRAAPTYDLAGIRATEPTMSLDKTKSFSYDWTLQYLVNYNRTFAQKHNVSATVGYEANYAWTDNLWGQRTGYTLPVDQMGAGPASTQKNSATEAEQGRAGWIGRVKYGYDERYIAEITMRYDGSDWFPKDKRWGLFYSGSLAWNIANEKFFEGVRDNNIFNTLKLRASYGQTGLTNITDANGDPWRFAYLSSYGYDANGYILNGGISPTFSAPGTFPSPDISWWTRNTLDIGLDFSSLAGRLRGSIDYFYATTVGYLSSPTTTSYTQPVGISLPMVRSDGEHRKEGVDLGISWNDRTGGGFTYEVGVNFTYFDQLVSKNYSESEANIKNPYKRSTQQTGYWGTGYANNGYFTSSQDVMNSPRINTVTYLLPGDLKYRDFNGDGQIDGNDEIRIGKNSFPRANYGVYGNFGYKGVFLNILIQGATDRDVALTNDLRSSTSAQSQFIYPFQLDYWTPSNPNAKFPRVQNSAKYYTSNNTNPNSDFWLVNSAYIRLKTVEVGYDFKHTLLRNVNWLSTLRLTLSGNNLFTISDASKYGFDPENTNGSSYAGYSYPVVRTFALGLQIGF